jgi:hypothetical protein
MKRDAHLLFWVVFIDALYLVSFFLPTYSTTRPHFGWEVFVDSFHGLFQPRDTENLSGMLLVWLPNPLLWAGVVCFWARRPHFAFVAGGMAAVFAAYTLYLLHSLDGTRLLTPANSLWDRSGAYVWSASMLSLAIAGLIFTIKQWRQTRRLPMVGE